MEFIYDHMKRLKSEGNLREDSLAMALVNFGELPEISRRDVIAEIIVFFVAGLLNFLLELFHTFRDGHHCPHTIIRNLCPCSLSRSKGGANKKLISGF
jgi:hypothetical protein